MVAGYLPEGVAAVGDTGKVLDGPAVVLDRIQHRTGIEEVVAVHILLRETLVIDPGLLGVAEHEGRLGDYPREPFPPFLRGAGIYALAFLERVGVVMQVELAVDQIEFRQGPEPRIRSRIGEEFPGGGEVLPSVEYHAAEILRGRHVFGTGEAVEGLEKPECLVSHSQFEAAIRPVESQFGPRGARQHPGVDLRELQRRLGIEPLVEKYPRVLEAYLGRQHRRPVGPLVFAHKCLVIPRAQFDRAQHGISVHEGVPFESLENGPRLFVHSVFIEFQGLAVSIASSAVVCRGERPCKRQGQQTRQYFYRCHFIFLLLNSQIYSFFPLYLQSVHQKHTPPWKKNPFP